ncbi:MAG TPA: TolC family protein [Acidobacteriota bacterium]|nr:TolC family protein [Acidobacteriota bacterium]
MKTTYKCYSNFVIHNLAGIRLPLNKFFVFVLLFFGAGCSAKVSRVEHAGVFPGQLKEKTAAVLPGRPVTLTECIDIALANNLNLRALEIKKRLASLDRSIAFGNFLPAVELQFSYRATDNPQLRRTQGGLFQLSDQRLAQTAIETLQPIFLPQAWYLYDMRRKGEDISSLVLQRTRQLITLEVTSRYFSSLSLKEAADYINIATESAEAMLRETKAFEREGLVMSSQRQQAEVLVMESRLARDNVARLLTQNKADLLSAMGLSPFAEMELKQEMPFSPAGESSLEEDVLEALINRLELHIDDRTLEIRKQETRKAIAAFLPRIIGFGSFTHSSDSFLEYAGMWSYGISTILSVFDGFQNLFGYRAAREREREAFVKREQTCMMIMIEVLRARHRVEQVTDSMKIATISLAVAEERFRETEALWREGMIQLSEAMDAVTQREQARLILSMSRFQEQVALATLTDVLGRTKQEF